jgi:hypothetical protein
MERNRKMNYQWLLAIVIWTLLKNHHRKCWLKICRVHLYSNLIIKEEEQVETITNNNNWALIHKTVNFFILVLALLFLTIKALLQLLQLYIKLILSTNMVWQTLEAALSVKQVELLGSIITETTLATNLLI